jgi:hypothetical protein
VRTAAVTPVFGFIVLLVSEIQQSREAVGGGKYDVASVSPIPPVRSTARNEHLSAETAYPVAAAAGSDLYVGFVDEHTGTASKGCP